MSLLLLWLTGRMTTAVVARECDRPRQTLASIKSGKMRPSDDDIAALAKWAGLTQREVTAAIQWHTSRTSKARR